SIAEQMRAVLLPAGLPSPSRADDDRVGGWMLMHEMLKYGKWLIGPCPKLIECLPLMSRDDKKVEDCCFVAGTWIKTREGEIPIQCLHPGQEVLTRWGYRPVLRVKKTHQSAPVFTLTAGEYQLTGTADHPVW